MSLQEFRMWLRDLSCQTTYPKGSHGDLPFVVAHCLQDFMRRRWDAEIEKNQGRPLMQIYMADGWGASVNQVREYKIGGHSLRRVGKHRHEFLLQRHVLQTMEGIVSPPKLLMIMSEPKSMRHGRGSWNVFQAACDGPPTLRNAGHKGIAVQVYCFDGQLFSALTKRFSELTVAWYSVCYQEWDAALLRSTDWPLFVKCRSHSCSNAIAWGMKLLSSALSNHKDPYIAVCALRNSSSELHVHIPEFAGSSRVLSHSQWTCARH